MYSNSSPCSQSHHCFSLQKYNSFTNHRLQSGLQILKPFCPGSIRPTIGTCEAWSHSGPPKILHGYFYTLLPAQRYTRIKICAVSDGFWQWWVKERTECQYWLHSNGSQALHTVVAGAIVFTAKWSRVVAVSTEFCNNHTAEITLTCEILRLLTSKMCICIAYNSKELLARRSLSA